MVNFFNRDREKSNSDDDSNLIENLKKVNYFEFLNPSDRDEFVQKIKVLYEESTIFSIPSIGHKKGCKKLFFCDNESLFEQGGFLSQIKSMKSGLEKITNYEVLKNDIQASLRLRNQQIINGVMPLKNLFHK